jgi:hypothetical protein
MIPEKECRAVKGSGQKDRRLQTRIKGR